MVNGGRPPGCRTSRIDIQREATQIRLRASADHHRVGLIGCRRAVTLMLADGLQRTGAPPLKLQ
jgi:hypothetical protein